MIIGDVEKTQRVNNLKKKEEMDRMNDIVSKVNDKGSRCQKEEKEIHWKVLCRKKETKPLKETIKTQNATSATPWGK